MILKKSNLIFLILTLASSNFVIWSCAATRHATVPADERAQVEQMIEERQYAVEFRYPDVDNPNKWRQERAVCQICGDTLWFFPYYDSQPRVAEKSFRIENYRQTTLESGAVEVTFAGRELIADGMSPVTIPWRFVILRPEYVEIHVDESLFLVTNTVFKGKLRRVQKE